MRGSPGPSRFKELASKHQVANAYGEGQSRERKEYLVEIDLTTESMQPIDTSLSHKLISSNSIPAAQIHSSSHKEAQRTQIIRQSQGTQLRSEQIPREYVDKLNRAIEDLHSFEAENTRLTAINQNTEQRNRQLQMLVDGLQQQISDRGWSNAEVNRFRSALQEKENQIRGYCARIKLIEQKLHDYELERKANIILSNYYSTLSALFGHEELEIEHLRMRIEEAVANSRKYEQMVGGMHHQQNEDLQRVIVDFNAVTFEKNNLELKLLNANQERQKLLGARQQDSNKIMKLGREVRELRQAIESLKSENDKLKLQAQTLNQSSASGKETAQQLTRCQQQLQLSRRREEVLRRQTAELRRVIEDYKTTLKQTESAHSRETEQMSAMMAELRKNYYQQSHRLQSSDSFDEVSSLKDELSRAHKTIMGLKLGQQELHTSNSFRSPNQQQVGQLTQELTQLRSEYVKLTNELESTLLHRKTDQLKIEQLRRALHEQNNTDSYKAGSASKLLVEQLQAERTVRKQLEVQLAIKSGQFEYLTGQLESLRTKDHRTQQGQSNSGRIIDQLRNSLADRQRDLHEAQAEVNTLRENCRLMDDQIAKQNQQFAKLTAEYIELENSSEQRQLLSKQEMNRYSLEMTENLTRMRQLVEEKHGMENQLSDLKYALEESRQELQRKLGEKDKLTEESHSKILRLEQTVARSNTELEVKLQELQQQLKVTRFERQQLSDSLAASKGQIQARQRQLATHQQMIASLQGEVSSREESIRKLYEELERTREDLSRHDSKRSQMSSSVTELQQRLQSNQQLIRKLQQELAMSQSFRDQQAQQLAEASEQIHGLQHQLELQKSKVMSLNRRLESQEASLAKLQTEVDAFSRENNQYQHSLSSAETINRRLEAELTGIRQSTNDQTSQLEAAYASIRKLEYELSSVQINLNDQCMEAQIKNRQLIVQTGQLHQQLTEADLELSRLRSELDRAKTEALAANERSTRYQQEVDSLRVEIRKAYEHVDNSRAQYTHQLSQLQQMQNQQLMEKHAEIQELKEQIERLKHEMSYSQKNIHEMQEEHGMIVAAREASIRELQGRLALIQKELMSEADRNADLKRLYEEQMSVLGDQVRQRQAQREEAQRKLTATEQKFVNLKVVYSQVEEAANGFKNQVEVLRNQSQRRQTEFQEHLRLVQERNSQKLSEFVERHTTLERKISEAVSHSQQDYARRMAEAQSRQLQLQDKHHRQLQQRDLTIVQLKKEKETYTAKTEERYRRIQQELERKEQSHRQEVAHLTNQLLQSNHQELSSQQARQLQVAEMQEELQRQMAEHKRQAARAVEELNDMKYKMSLSTMEYESRVQQLREKLRVMQNRFDETRNEWSVRETRQSEQIRTVKEEHYALQAEKIAIGTKLQMAGIRVEELESEVQHLRNQLEDSRHQQRLQLLEFGTPSREGAPSSEILSEDAQSVRNTDELDILKNAFGDEDSSASANALELNFLKQRPENSRIALTGSVDTHINFNYSKYYEENLRQIKSSMIGNTTAVNNPPNHQFFPSVKLKSSGIQSEQRPSSVMRRTAESPKQGLTFSNPPNIPKSPKLFPPDVVVTEPKVSTPNKRSTPAQSRHPSVYITNAMSTQSLNIETESSASQLNSHIRIVESRQET